MTAPMLTQGSVVGEYRVESAVREGVYRARQAGLGRTVSLHVAGGDGAAFAAVARAAAEIEHPSVLPVYEVGSVDGVAFAAVREAPGRRLDELLGEGPLAADRALVLGRQLAGALEALGEAGVVVEELPASAVAVAGERVYLSPLDAGAAPRLEGGAGSVPALARLLGAMVDGSTRARWQTTLSRAQPSASALLAELEPARRSRRRPRIAIAAVLALLVATVGVGAVVTAGGEEESRRAPRFSSPAAPAARIVGRVPIGARPASVLSDGRWLWVTTDKGEVVRVDPVAGQVVGAPIKVTAKRDTYGGIAVAPGALFIATGTRLRRYDLARRRVVRSATTASEIVDLAYGGGTLWALRIRDTDSAPVSDVVRLDPATLRQRGRATSVDPLAFDIEAGDGAAWVAARSFGTIFRIDAATGRAARTKTGAQTDHATLAGSVLWAVDPASGTLVPLQAQTLRPQPGTVRMLNPRYATWAAGGLWIVAERVKGGAISLHRVDPRARRTSGRPLSLGPGPPGLTASRGSDLWVAMPQQRALLRVRPTVPPPAPQAPAARPRDELLAGPLASGRWRVLRFGAPLEVAVEGSGWLATGVHREVVELARTDDVSASLTFAMPEAVFGRDKRIQAARSPAQALRALRSIGPALRVGDTQRMTLGGGPALAVDLEVPPGTRAPDFCGVPCVSLFGGGDVTLVVAQDLRARLILTQRGGQLVAILAHAEPGTGTYTRLLEVLDTVRFVGRR